MQWEDEHYRPIVLKSVGFFFRHRIIGSPLLVAGLALLFLPTAARERILFRKRDKTTRRIAAKMSSRVHLDCPGYEPE